MDFRDLFSIGYFPGAEALGISEDMANSLSALPMEQFQDQQFALDYSIRSEPSMPAVQDDRQAHHNAGFDKNSSIMVLLPMSWVHNDIDFEIVKTLLELSPKQQHGNSSSMTTMQQDQKARLEVATELVGMDKIQPSSECVSERAIPIEQQEEQEYIPFMVCLCENLQRNGMLTTHYLSKLEQWKRRLNDKAEETAVA